MVVNNAFSSLNLARSHNGAMCCIGGVETGLLLFVANFTRRSFSFGCWNDARLAKREVAACVFALSDKSPVSALAATFSFCHAWLFSWIAHLAQRLLLPRKECFQHSNISHLMASLHSIGRETHAMSSFIMLISNMQIFISPKIVRNGESCN